MASARHSLSTHCWSQRRAWRSSLHASPPPRRARTGSSTSTHTHTCTLPLLSFLFLLSLFGFFSSSFSRINRTNLIGCTGAGRMCAHVGWNCREAVCKRERDGGALANTTLRILDLLNVNLRQWRPDLGANTTCRLAF